MYKIRISVLCSCFFLTSCLQNDTTGKPVQFSEVQIKCKYAKGFFITYNNMYKILTVKNPWQGAKDISIEYFLIGRDREIPAELKDKNVIRIPLKKIVCLSTTHVAMIDFLDEKNSIVGIAGTDYVVNPGIRKLIDDGKIKNVGYDNNLNYELLMGLHPDAVIIYGVGSETSQITGKLRDLGIPCIVNAEYLEQDVLAKTEWVKFFASLFNKEKFAEEKFLKIETEYLYLKSLTENIKNKPKILTGLPWKGTWWVPGGKSHMAQLITDAGGDYLWKQNTSGESFSLSIESVFEKSVYAEIWINSGSAKNMNEIFSTDERIKNFYPAKTGNIFNNNAILNQYGGNDFWESGIVSPHLILKDMIKIFHPEILPGYQLKYYKKIF